LMAITTVIVAQRSVMIVMNLTYLMVGGGLTILTVTVA